jgi:uncharacterized protein (TIGR00730 family)
MNLQYLLETSMNDINNTLILAENKLSAETSGLRTFLYKDIVRNAVKCQGLDILDLKIMDRVLAEYQHAACVFKPYRSTRKVSIFGSSRVAEGSPCYELAVDFGRSMAEKGYMVITGAAEGIMKAGIEGAGAENSFGVNIMLPSEQGAASVIRDDPKLVTFKYFFIRKLFFVMEADAIALFPGGFGTQDEGFEVLTLLQTAKAPLMPVVLMEHPGEGYWEAWDSFIRQQMLARNYIRPDDIAFYKIMHSSNEAADWIQSYYSTYHSMRRVKDKIVIRLETELLDSQIEILNHEFRDLLKLGRIYKTLALPDEWDEPDIRSKPRIAFRYNNASAGRLNKLVLTINEMGNALTGKERKRQGLNTTLTKP